MAVSERESSPGASDSEAQITLGLLNAVHENEGLTQRSAATQLGIALGLTNAYLKRCVKKGLIKVQQIPPNRYAYYLTPKGFAEKSRLTAEYLTSSFTYFRRARGQYDELLEACARRGWRRVALFGRSELAEIAVLCAGQRDVVLTGLVDESGDARPFFGLAVAADLAALGPADAVLLTDLSRPEDSYARLVAARGAERVLAPRLLGVGPLRKAGARAAGGAAP